LQIQSEVEELKKMLAQAEEREYALRKKIELRAEGLDLGGYAQIPPSIQLSNNEIKARLAIEAAGMGSFEWDLEEKIFMSSPRLRQIFGFSPHDNPSHLDFQQRIHPKDKHIRDREVEAAIVSGSMNYEVRIIWPDDSIHWLKIYGKISYTEHNRPWRMHGMAMDITEQKNTEFQLISSEERLRLAISTTNLGTWDYQPNTGKLTWSPECKKIYEIPDNETISFENFANHIYHEDKEWVLKAITDSMAPGSSGDYDIQYRIITYGTEKIKWIRATGKVIFDSAKQPESFLGTVVDITSDKLSELSLRRQVDEIRTVLEALPQMAWTANGEGYVNYFTKNWTAYTGQPNEDAIGNGWSSFIHPDHIATAFASWSGSINTGNELNIEIPIRSAEDTYRWMSVKAVPIRNSKGEIIMWAGLVSDIHDQKHFATELENLVSKRTEELKKATELLQNKNRELEQKIFSDFSESFGSYKTGESFFNSITLELAEKTNMDFVYLGKSSESEGGCIVKTFSFCMGGQLTENIEYDLHGSPCEEVMRPQLVSYAEGCYKNYPQNKGLQDLKMEGYIGCPLLNSEDEVIGLIIAASKNIIPDLAYNESLIKIAARRCEIELERQLNQDLLAEKNAALERQNEELASFTFIASHDLQEPLRKIQTFAGRIMDTESDHFTPNGKQYFDRMINAAQRMQQLIEDLLSYSRTNKSDISFEQTDLNMVLEEAVNHIREVNEKQVEITAERLPSLPVISGQVLQLFSNIISNAVKYAKANVVPSIEIRCREVRLATDHPNEAKGHFWQIDFADNGIGFSNEYRSKIFELFQRLHTRQEYAGTGLGLAICKKIMSNHQGFITANGIEGEGSTFSLYFPAK